MVISDKFLQIAGRLPSNKIYGFGESEHPTYAHDTNWKRWGIFARDQPVTVTINSSSLFLTDYLTF